MEGAPPEVKAILSDIPLDYLEFVPLTTEILALRDAYVRAGVVSPQWLNDAAHVAAATVARADAIVSWNFKHIVRLEKSKYPPAEPEALRLLAPQRGLIATDQNQNPRLATSGLIGKSGKGLGEADC